MKNKILFWNLKEPIKFINSDPVLVLNITK